MKKIILGVIIGTGLTISGVAFAYKVDVTDLSVVDRFRPISSLEVIKIYDKANGAVCYLYQGTAISCLK